MTYTLEQFCADCRRTLSEHPGSDGRERVRDLLERLLANREFVEATLGPDATPGRHALYEDPELGFVVLAHVNNDAHESPPHDHGTSWAVYGQAKEWTDMTEWRRTDEGDDEGVELEPVRTYRLEPGKAGLYDVGAIHSIHYPAGARFVRVTGRDLDQVPRTKYDLAAHRAVRIESASAGRA